MSDENLSKVEVILRENLPISFTVRVSSSAPRHYTVIPSSEFNSSKETLQDNEVTYAFFGICFGKQESDCDITELRKLLNKCSLEAKEVNRIYVQFGDNVRYSEIEETLHLLENESNVIKVFPDVLKR